MSPVRVLGTLVLMLVLPCAFILCFVLQCYADYLRRNDDQNLESIRQQAQERRLSRQRQMRGNLPVNQNNKMSSITTLSEAFYFHTIQQHDKSIPWQTGTKVSTIIDKTIATTKSDASDVDENHNSSTKEEDTAAAEPDGFKTEDDEDDNDLELCLPVPKSNRTTQPYQSFYILRDMFFRGTNDGSSDEKTKKKKNNNPSPTFFESSSMQTNTSRSRKGEGVAAEEDEDCCCICLEGYAKGEVICTPKQGDCNHIFHKECLFEWIKQNHDCCPLCRVVLIE
mmetsp:Transcript_10983/g.26571  ORF Transcript_10983/g.26571 Transcript_10983/m.26571 type:complete len:281 (-) Transcript_10983:230-1072(-)